METITCTHVEICTKLGISPHIDLTDICGQSGNGLRVVRADFSGGSRHTYTIRPL